MMILASSICDASLTDDARVIINDRNMFIIQATSVNVTKLFSSSLKSRIKKLECLSPGNF
jgi:hypothetical protein